MQPDSLEAKTQVYWHISSAYNGRTPKPITAEQLFKRTNDCLSVLDPARLLSRKFHELRNEVVRGPELEDAANMTANQ